VSRRRVSASTARQLLSDGLYRIDSELSKSLLCTVHVLADGSALLTYTDGRTFQYDSYDDLVARWREKGGLSGKPINYLHELLPQGFAFAEAVSNLIESLPARLKIDHDILDLSERSLAAIDLAIADMSPSEVLTAEIFAPLVAYVGEVIRKETGGRWQMRRDSYDNEWVPWIVNDAGASYAPVRIYKEFLELGSAASMRAFVDGTIGGWRHNRRPIS